MPSMSEPSAMTGLPDPHVAIHAVGMPATPRSTLKPFFSRIPVRYLDVSTSWKPSSPKLNTMSTICCVSVASPSTPLAASVLSAASRGSSSGGADGRGRVVSADCDDLLGDLAGACALAPPAASTESIAAVTAVATGLGTLERLRDIRNSETGWATGLHT